MVMVISSLRGSTTFVALVALLGLQRINLEDYSLTELWLGIDPSATHGYHKYLYNHLLGDLSM